MRLLLDENLSPRTATILTILGHPTERVGDGARDEDLAGSINQYDAFVTFDLHRQLSARQAINRAIVGGGTVIRLRIAKGDPKEVMTQVRFLIAKWPEIERLLGSRSEIGLLTITEEGQRIRATDRARIAQWLADDG